MELSGTTLVLLAVLVALPGSTKTDQTLGRSVALLAQLHPKCPFQVEASARPSVLDFGLRSTEVLGTGGTIGSRKCTGQYACVPIGTGVHSSGIGLGSTPRSLADLA